MTLIDNLGCRKRCCSMGFQRLWRQRVQHFFATPHVFDSGGRHVRSELRSTHPTDMAPCMANTMASIAPSAAAADARSTSSFLSSAYQRGYGAFRCTDIRRWVRMRLAIATAALA